MDNNIKLEQKSFTIFEAVKNIRAGRWVIPSFQRSYVWRKDQVEKLWDSILTGYPISTFLFWKVNNDVISERTRFYSFVNVAEFRGKKTCGLRPEKGSNSDEEKADITYEKSVFYGEEGSTPIDCAVLDGQQRLTSIYLSLVGSCSLKAGHQAAAPASLYIQLDKDEVEEDSDEDGMKSTTYSIKFMKDGCQEVVRANGALFKLKNICSEEYLDKSTRAAAIDNYVKNLAFGTQDYARKVLNLICERIFGSIQDTNNQLINAQQMQVQSEDDALEMFIRFNNGGKPLSKIDIVSSILTSCWADADNSIREVLEYKESSTKGKKKDILFQAEESRLENSRKHFFEYNDFGLGFIIRAAMMLYSSNIQASINDKIINDLSKNWSKFKNALANMQLLLFSINRLRIYSFKNRWNVLLPILYLVYYNPNYKENKDGVKAYLSRAILLKYFQSGTISKLTKLRNMMSKNTEKPYPILTVDMINNFPDLEVTEEKIEKILKTPKENIFAYFTLELLSSSWMESGAEYHVDHLHPKAMFDRSPINNINFNTWNQWQGMSNLLPNLELLKGPDNIQKNAAPLHYYINDFGTEKEKMEFAQRAMIVENSAIIPTNLKDFDVFYAKRKQILHDKLCELMVYKPKKDIFE